MAHFVGLDVSVGETSVCVIDDVGKVLCERKVRTEPEDIAMLLTSVGGDYVRIGIERPAIAVAGEWPDGGGPAGRVCGNAAHGRPCRRPSRSTSLTATMHAE